MLLPRDLTSWDRGDLLTLIASLQEQVVVATDRRLADIQNLLVRQAGVDAVY